MRLINFGLMLIKVKVKIEIREKHSYTLEREWYEFKIKLGDESLRRFLNNPTLITIDLSFEPKIYQPKEKEFVLNLYKRKSNQGLETDRGNIQSLKIIEREINRVKKHSFMSYFKMLTIILY